MRNPRVWVGIAVSALFVVLLLRQVDRDEVVAELLNLRGNAGWLVLAVGVEFIALWVRALRWRVVLDSAVRISTGEAWSVLMIGYAANNLLPLRAGELVRAQLLYAAHGTGRLATLGTIVVERILDVLVLALFLASALVFVGDGTVLRQLAFLLLAVALLASALLAGLTAWPRGADMLVRMLSVLPEAIRPRATAALVSFLKGLRAVRGTRAWFAVVATSFATWGLEAAAYWLVGVAFGLPLSLGAFFGVAGAANLALAVPSTTGGIGPFEWSTQQMLDAFGVSITQGAAYALVLHALLLVPVVVVGLLLLWRQNLGLGTIVHAQRAAAEGTVEAAVK